MSEFDLLDNKILFKKYKCMEKIGKGSFGCVYKGINILDKSEVAIKFEKKICESHLLENESNYLSILKGYGIPQIKSYGIYRNFYVLIEELLGYNLSEIKGKIKSFTLKDIPMLALQIIDRIEFIHSKNIIHRDIKPENFMTGYKNPSVIYIIDFGISKKYRSSRTGKHLKYELTGKLFGTARYVSYNGSRGVELSRRDDLESIGYMLIYLYKGKLPWQGIRLREKNAKSQYLEMLYLKKFTKPEILCSGLPPEFTEYIKYTKKLLFEQDPDYDYLRNLFRRVLLRMNQINDMKFSWVKKNNYFRKNKSEVDLMNKSKEKYINLLKRKESSQTRLYKSIRQSLERDEKSRKQIAKSKSELLYPTNISFNNNIINSQNKNKRVESTDKSEVINKGMDNSNISKDVLSYNSQKAQYNYDIAGFQDEKKVFELFYLRRNNLIKNKKSAFSPNNNITYINMDRFKKNQFDIKTSDSKFVKKSDNYSLNYKNNNNNSNEKIMNKKLNLSIDLDNNHINKSKLLENEIYSSPSYSEITNNIFIPKLQFNPKEIKRRYLCENIYNNILNRINHQLNPLKLENNCIIENKAFSYDRSNNLITNNINIHNLKKSNNNNNFSFNNYFYNKNEKSNNNKINNNFQSNYNSFNNNSNNVNIINGNNNVKKIEVYNAKKGVDINIYSIPFSLNSL